MSRIISSVFIDRIAMQYLDIDSMEKVNTITGIDQDHEVNFVDKSVFEEHQQLKEYVENKNKLILLQKGKIDYIVFRLDI